MASVADFTAFEYIDPGRRVFFQSVLDAAKRAGLPPQELFQRFAEAMPFHLGESRAEAALPYAVSDVLDTLCTQAVDDLLELLRSRYEVKAADARTALAAGETLEREAKVRRAPAPGWAARNLPAGPQGAAISAAAHLDPHLDTALVETWVRTGPAGLFVEELVRLLAAAAEEDVKGQGKTRFGLLTAAALVDLCEAKKAVAKTVSLRLLPYEKLEKAMGLALYALCDAAAGAALSPVAIRPVPFDMSAATGLVRAAINPLAFISIRSRALQNHVNPWGLSVELAHTMEPVYAEMLSDDPDPTTIELRLETAIRERRPLLDQVVPVAHAAAARERILDALGRIEHRDAELTSELAAAARSPEELARHLADPRPLGTRIARLLRSARLDGFEAAALQQLVDVLRGVTEAEAAARAASAFAGFALDRFATDQLDAARARLRDRRGEMPAGDLKTEYERGKLYRVAGDGRPMLKEQLSRQAEGHLFVDLKGYTQRTHRVKELVMAEFLREEFYKPILGAAAAVQRESGGDPEALRLQNLLGDAAAFSGQVQLLVALARHIQRICAEYGAKLAARTSGVRPEQILDRRRNTVAQAEAEIERLRIERSLIEAELQRKRALPLEQKEQQLREMYARRVTDLGRRRSEALDRARNAADDALRAAGVEEIRRHDATIAALELRGRELFANLEAMDEDGRSLAILDFLTTTERGRMLEIDGASKARQKALEAQLRGFEEELRAAQGFGLEAGLFITHGAQAEVVRIADETWGEVRVAVAEKINEAARGTARNSQLKAKLEAHLERVRRERGDGRIAYPFHVYVDSAYGVVLSPELSAVVETAIRSRDGGKITEAGQKLGEALARDLARAGEATAAPELLTVVNDIYNVGEALSAEALDAFVTETLTKRYHFGRSVPVAGLAAEIRERFAFLEDTLELVVSFPHGNAVQGAIAFRLAGRVHFRGFEAKAATAVYELLRPDSEFHRLLSTHHLAAWAAEARENPISLLTRLGP